MSIVELFRRKQLLRGQHRVTKQRPPRRATGKFLLEPLESRLLLSVTPMLAPEPPIWVESSPNLPVITEPWVPQSATAEVLGEQLAYAARHGDLGNQTGTNISKSQVTEAAQIVIAHEAAPTERTETAPDPQVSARTTPTPELPGLQLADPDTSRFEGQVFWLNFDGADDVTYNGPVTIGPFDAPALRAPAPLAGREADIAAAVTSQLNDLFAEVGVEFVASPPANVSEYSTIIIGGDGGAFSAYGVFHGLTEQVDYGNADRADNAFVFPENLLFGEIGFGAYVTDLSQIVAHEAGHSLGYAHTVNSEQAGPLSEVADTGTKAGSNSNDKTYTTWNNWVYTPITISGAPSNAIINSATVAWNVDSNFVSDIDWYVENYPYWSSSIYTDMAKTGDDWFDGYSETSDGSRTVYPSSSCPVNGTWYLNIKDNYNDPNPDWNKGRIDSWSITINYSYTVPQVTSLGWRSGSSSGSSTISSREAGQTAYLGATATGMNGQTITVTIYEKDDFSPDDVIGTRSITFDASGWGSASWTADWQEGDGLPPYQDYYFYYAPQDLYGNDLIVTDTTAPSAFDLSGPANGAVFTSGSIGFSWGSSADSAYGSGFKSYTLQVDNNADFSSPVINHTGLASPASTETISAADTYYWRAIAYDNNNNARYSTSTRNFQSSILNPFDLADFSSIQGQAVQQLFEQIAGDSFPNIEQEMLAALGGVEASAVAEVSFHIVGGVSINHGAVAEISTVELTSGYALAYDLANHEWKLSRGLSLELLGTYELAAEEYVRLTADNHVWAGFEISNTIGPPIPTIEIGPTTLLGAELQAQIDIDYGTTWAFAVETEFTVPEFCSAVGQPTLAGAVLDVFTPYGDPWWQRILEGSPYGPLGVAVSDSVDLLGITEYNNSPISLLNDGIGLCT